MGARRSMQMNRLVIIFYDIHSTILMQLVDNGERR